MVERTGGKDKMPLYQQTVFLLVSPKANTQLNYKAKFMSYKELENSVLNIAWEYLVQ